MKSIMVKLFLTCATFSYIKLQQDEYCLSLDEKGHCQKCALSFVNDKFTCEKPLNKIENCLVYQQFDGRVICQFCNYGYKLNSTFDQCDKITMQGCLQAVSDVCVACKQNIQVNEGQCNTDKEIQIPNCMISSGIVDEPFCVVCENNFALLVQDITHNDCVKLNESTQNCSLLYETDQCEACEFNYYMTSDRKCLKSSKYSVELFLQGSKIVLYFALFLAVF